MTVVTPMLSLKPTSKKRTCNERHEDSDRERCRHPRSDRPHRGWRVGVNAARSAAADDPTPTVTFTSVPLTASEEAAREQVEIGNEAAVMRGAQEQAQVYKDAQAAAAKAAADAAAAQAAAQASAAKHTTPQQTTHTNGSSESNPAPSQPVRCPTGSQANSGDAGGDTSCFPVICFTIVLPDPAHPECVTPFKP